MRQQFLPITIIEDGQLLRSNLPPAKKDEAWVEKVLTQRGATVKTTWLLTVDRANHILFIPKEEQP